MLLFNFDQAIIQVSNYGKMMKLVRLKKKETVIMS